MNLWISASISIFVILLPILLAILLRKRRKVPWYIFCVGILTFLGAQVVHLPLNRLLSEIGLLPTGTPEGISLIWMAAVLGLTAGLTEELARVVGYAVVGKARRYEDGIMMGLGHGGLEAMVLSALTIASVASLTFLIESGTMPVDLSPEQSAALDRQLGIMNSSPIASLLPAVERVIALAIQVSLSVMVLQAFVRRNWLYVVAAILIHALFDFVAVIGVNLIESFWILEGMLALFTLPLVIWLWHLKPSRVGKTPKISYTITQEIHTFGNSVAKEFLYQWRSRRLIIVCAVFLVFGMISPLLAKFTPQLLGSIEEAQQFAELIPEPTIDDAYDQYIRNITQFGFILAILLGMGAIAGEKERGTASMILSKPLSRGFFVVSKYVAQSAVYLLAFILAAIAATYYMVILFDTVNLVAFLAINLLLLAWLLVFAAITLLGSAIGRTTVAAGGMAFLGSVLVFLLGSIPQFGALAPGGLIVWANQLAVGESVAPNTGALAMSLVFVLILLITAVAVFEQQEL